jgi:hypothetical protein
MPPAKDPNRPCPACGTTDPAAFNWRTDKRSGVTTRQPRCRLCHNKQSKNNGRNYQLYRDYGITEFQYNLILKSQNGNCAICGGVNASGKALAVDHCHETNKIRGLLCDNCNPGLGYFKDDKTLLLKAITYLETPP